MPQFLRGGLHKCGTEFHWRGLVLETFGQTAFVERQGEGKEGVQTMPRRVIRRTSESKRRLRTRRHPCAEGVKGWCLGHRHAPAPPVTVLHEDVPCDF